MLNALRLNEGFALRDFESRTGLDAQILEPALHRAACAGAARGNGAAVGAPSALGRRFLNDLQASFLP